MAKFATRMHDPYGDPQTSPQHGDPHGFVAFLKKTIQEIHVDRRVVGNGLWVAMWITHMGGKFRHGLLEKSLIFRTKSQKEECPEKGGKV